MFGNDGLTDLIFLIVLAAGATVALYALCRFVPYHVFSPYRRLNRNIDHMVAQGRLKRKAQIFEEMQRAKARGESYELPKDWDA